MPSLNQTPLGSPVRWKELDFGAILGSNLASALQLFIILSECVSLPVKWEWSGVTRNVRWYWHSAWLVPGTRKWIILSHPFSHILSSLLSYSLKKRGVKEKQWYNSLLKINLKNCRDITRTRSFQQEVNIWKKAVIPLSDGKHLLQIRVVYQYWFLMTCLSFWNIQIVWSD